MSFLSKFNCLPTPTRPNTTVLFKLVDPSKPKLSPPPSPFIIQAWSTLLLQYPDQTLRLHLVMLLRFGCLIGYKGPDAFINSKKLPSALIQPDVIDQNIASNLALGRIIEIDAPTNHFISSPLGLVPKHDGGFRKIHHLSYPHGSSVNDYIASEASTLSYSSLQNVFQQIVNAGRHAVLIKRDIKDAFRNTPIAPHIRWLLGFQWAGVHYEETWLPFGLSTAPFIFNLFVEAFHWILESYLHFPIEHYLDDFIATIPANQANPDTLARYDSDYETVTDSFASNRTHDQDPTYLHLSLILRSYRLFSVL